MPSSLSHQWQLQLPATMDHDKARPGAQVIQVALESLQRQEVRRANGRHGLTVLMDMSTFYDTIQLDRLQQEALTPLMLEMAMQVYTGPKAIVAGCPQAPLLAKAGLAPALTALTPYRDLRQRLVALVLQVNPKKTAFITTDKSADKELRSLLREDEPPIALVMRDLGIDHQAARRRRIPVLKQRLAKAKNLRTKLKALKIPALPVRLRLRRGGIHTVAQWCVESQGLAPRYRTGLRQAMAKHLGHHTGGNLDSAYDLQKGRYMDPGDQIMIHHIKAMYQLIHAWPPRRGSTSNRPGSKRINDSQKNSTLVYRSRSNGSHHCLPPRTALADTRSHALDQGRRPISPEK